MIGTEDQSDDRGAR
jgi:hypothetical protein